MLSSNCQIANSDCIVIGGDITGLVIANIIQRKGIKVTVLDDGRDIGGRLATHRINHEGSIEGVFDYGIQYFSVKNPQFQVWVDDWLEHNVVKEWGQGFEKLEKVSCYCGINGNQRIAQYLAKNLNVRTNTKVTKVGYDKKWLIETDEDQKYQGDLLVMTSPIPHSLSLLDASLIPLPLEVRFALEEIEYDKCIAVLALLEKPSNIPSPGGIFLEDYSVAWLADNNQKGISPKGYAVTIHATPEFSDYYWNFDDDEIVYKLISAAADYLDSRTIQYQMHRWHYYLPKNFYDELCLTLLELPLIMAGTAFSSASLEGAVTSGIAAAKSIGQLFRINV